jgi:hypothetical protein
MPTVMRAGRLAGQTRGLLRCGVWAGPFFAAAFLAEGAARDGYRPLRHPVSSLALGPRGWTQTANFAVTGALCLAAAAGLRLAGDRLTDSRTGPIMVAAAGAGLIGSAAFRTDPVGGYPPGTPDLPAAPSRAGAAHNLAAAPVFLGLPAAAACYGWRSWRAGQPPGFAVYCAATAVTMPVAAALAGAGFGQPSRLSRYGGLLQRAGIITGFAWLTTVSARALPGQAGPGVLGGGHGERKFFPWRSRDLKTCAWTRGTPPGSARSGRPRSAAPGRPGMMAAC